MLKHTPTLVDESEAIRKSYEESRKLQLRPDQRNIVEFRHSLLDLVLRSYELVLSKRTSSECVNITKIEPNIRAVLTLRGASSEIFKIWKGTVSGYIERLAEIGLFHLARLREVTDDYRKLIEQLEQWFREQNREWDPQLSNEVLATCFRTQ
jgi:hypothetical protein